MLTKERSFLGFIYTTQLFPDLIRLRNLELNKNEFRRVRDIQLMYILLVIIIGVLGITASFFLPFMIWGTLCAIASGIAMTPSLCYLYVVIIDKY